MMRQLVAAFAFASAIAAAQGPAEFRDHAPLALPAPSALYRVTLPEAVFRDGRDLADVRVFNGRGETVPIALAAEPEPARESPQPQRLAVFPLATLQPFPATSRVKVQLADGTWIAVDAETKAAVAERRVAAYFLDTSGVKEPLQSLLLDWEVLPGQEVIRVRVEASDDLNSWRNVGTRASLVRLEQDGRKLEQPRVALGGIRTKYLRVVGESPFTLKTASAELQERTAPAGLATKRVTGAPGSRPGELVYDLGGRLPVEAVRVVPGEGNSVIAGTLFVRDAPEGTPSWVAQATFYRLTRDGMEIESPATHIRRRAARYWVVRTDPDKGGYGATLPQLEVQWRAPQLVFVARGEPPFTLAFGNPQAKPALLPIASLIPAYETHAEMKLPEAAAGAVTRAPSPRDDWPAWLRDVPPSKLALWVALVGAVALLAFMAWRLGSDAGKRR